MAEANTDDAERRRQAQGPTLSVSDLTKRFQRQGGAEVRAIDNTTLEAWPSEFIVLLGPSGCGKTTLLRCLAGLERPDSGRIEIQGRTVFSSEEEIYVGPERRGISMVFQSYALWPHMSAADNVAYPLKYGRSTQRMRRDEIARRVRDVLELVGIPELYQQYPHQMSGGQQQRVALARALVGGSSLVLFDEPLSNVDAKVREQLRGELLQMQQEIGFTAVYVTHDQEEALQLADRVAVISEGRIEQLGSPKDVYLNPATRGIGSFLGKMNQVEGSVSQSGDSVVVDSAFGPVVGHTAPAANIKVGERAFATWRPERSAILADPAANGWNHWSAKVIESRFSGPYTEVLLEVGSERVRHWGLGSVMLEEGSAVTLVVDPHEVRIFPDNST